MRGEFGFSSITQSWEFVGDAGPLNAFGDFADSAVTRLVDCIDADSPAQVTVRGRRVVLGVLCYAALSRVAYVERPPDERRPWPGTLGSDATMDQLRRAKRAWQAVVKRRLYHLL
jgi:hypothetical protein